VPEVEVDIEEPRTLQPTIGADIYASDIKIGKVEKVIINPQNRLVAAILAKAILPNANRLRENEIYSESQVIIPIETVRHANSTSIFLNVKAAVLAKFNEYDPSVYFTASQDWEAPYPYNCQDVLLPRPTGA
jgi:hypothetical protein